MTFKLLERQLIKFPGSLLLQLYLIFGTAGGMNVGAVSLSLSVSLPLIKMVSRVWSE